MTDWVVESAVADRARGRGADLRTGRRALVGLHVLALALVTAGAAAAQDAADDCALLSRHDFSDVAGAATVVLGAEVVPAGEGHPRYCRVTGYVDPQIQFELRLPTADWNGRYLQAGCGGFCGVVNADAAQDALAKHFAIAAHNMGHVGSAAALPLWGNEPGLRRDYGTRSTHVVAVAAKAISERYYGREPEYSYFRGCSTGGREALGSAQHHPGDFDGLIAGHPAFAARQGGIANNWDMRLLLDDQGRSVLSDADLSLINEAVLESCDALDGVVDGIIRDPRDCRFDASRLQCSTAQEEGCLSPDQVEVVSRLYDGPRNSAGQRLSPGGRPPGSELAWNDPGGIRLGLTTGYMAHLAFEENPPAGYSYRDFDFDRDLEKLEPMARVYDPVAPREAPDLDRFHAEGGKLILYHGWADPTVPPQGSVDYYGQVSARMGGDEAVSDWFRLFMVPGMFHCRGGDAPNTFDFLDEIVAWVEEGRAPERVVATQYAGETVVRTRPLFPYPRVAVHAGQGDPDDERNWEPAAPPERHEDRVEWIWAPR